MSKKQKTAVVAAFVAVIVLAAVAAVFLNIRDTSEGAKNFSIEIVSERDGYHEVQEAKSENLYLGEYLREVDWCAYDESAYGMFVVGFHGMEQDMAEEYWWHLAINGEDALVGVDEMPLADGDIYTFTLMHGF